MPGYPPDHSTDVGIIEEDAVIDLLAHVCDDGGDSGAGGDESTVGLHVIPVQSVTVRRLLGTLVCGIDVEDEIRLDLLSAAQGDSYHATTSILTFDTLFSAIHGETSVLAGPA